MPRKQSYEHVVDNSIKEIGRMGFQSEVTNGFKNGGWKLVYHTHDSRNSPKGFPDTIVADTPPLIVIELKVGNNKPGPEQLEWLAAFRDSGAMTFVLWPRHRKVLSHLYAGNFEHHLVQNRLHVYEKVIQ